MRASTGLNGEPLFPHGIGPVPPALASGDWKEDGACRQIDPDLWFPRSCNSTHTRAASICARCPVRRACLAWALVFDERFGIWGGLDPAERRPLQHRLAAGDSLLAVLLEAFPLRLVPESRGGEVA